MNEKPLPKEIFFWQNSDRSRPYATRGNLTAGMRGRRWVGGRVYVARTEWVDITDEFFDENGHRK